MKLLIAFLLLIVLAACIPEADNPTEVPLQVAEAPDIQESTSEPLPTPTLTPAATLVPTRTPAPTFTPVSTPTPIATPTPLPPPTWTPEPTREPEPTWTPVPTFTPVPTPTPTPTPLPTPTPTPTPIPGPDLGDWEYFGPECPDGFPNCVLQSDDPSILLEAYGYKDNWLYNEPWISISCYEGDWSFLFWSGGPSLGGFGKRVSLEASLKSDSQQSTGYFRKTIEFNFLSKSLSFYGDEAGRLLRFLEAAAQENEDVRIFVIGYNSVWGYFDVTGLTANLQRLPC